MNEQNIYIVRCGEVALKGQNKPYFERMLVERIKKLLKRIGNVKVTRKEGLIFVYTDKDLDKDLVLKEVGKVFGIASISPAVAVESNIDSIGEEAGRLLQEAMKEKQIKTFKIEAKRADKNFPIKSPEMAKIVGGKVLDACPELKVDVHNPEARVFIDLRKDITYLYEEKISAHGGLPLGSNGKGLVLLSGGIDSPVAAWMMAKRGMAVEALHFHSYPYTSERAQEKVEDLASILATYCSRFKMHIINLLPIHEEIVKNCPEEETTILVRRFMMKIGESIAKNNQCDMLVTGESLGQVASQTSDSLVVTDNGIDMPVMRPLIALDKVDIMDIAKEIGTYETSIMPFEDCCTVFLPKHPVTRPKLERILNSESKLKVEELIENAIESKETIDIYPK